MPTEYFFVPKYSSKYGKKQQTEKLTCTEKSYSILICLVHISLTITIFSVVLYRFIN